MLVVSDPTIRATVALVLVMCAVAGGEIERTTRAVVPEVMPGEPFGLEVRWTNTGDRSVPLENWHIAALEVEGPAGKGPTTYWINPSKRIMSPRQRIQPGDSFVHVYLASIGRTARTWKTDPVFLLPEPGEYRVWPRGGDPSKAVTVKVVPASQRPGAEAAELWTVPVARVVCGEFGTREEAMPNIDKLIGEHPNSRYTAYALWAKANVKDMKRRNTQARERPYVLLWERLLDRYETTAVDRAALEALVHAYERLAGASLDPSYGYLFHQAAADLREAYPDSPAAKGLSRRVDEKQLAFTGKDLWAKLNAEIHVLGGGALPPGALPAFTDYLEARTGGGVDVVKRTIARDFMSDYGCRREFIRHGGDPFEPTTTSVKVRITSAEMTDTFSRIASRRGGDARTWHGPICDVRGAAAWTERGGKTTFGFARWALYRYPDKSWGVLSETIRTPRQRMSDYLVHLRQSLGTTFAEWHVPGTDGHDRHPYAEVLEAAGLADAPKVELLEVRPGDAVMPGDEPGATLHLTVRMRAKETSTVEKTVKLKMHLALDKAGELQLESLDVTSAE